jgi:hypothetical protein
MHIYIDESGGFIPLKPHKSRISAVAALAIPSASHDELLNRFIELRSRFAPSDLEIKGSALHEPAMAEIAELLAEFNVVGEVVAIDMGDLDQRGVRVFQQQQAELISLYQVTDNIPEAEKPWILLRNLLLSLSPQNFIQAYMMIVLIEQVLQTVTAYHSQRDARELSTLDWVIDAKNEKISAAEETWTKLVFPALSIASAAHPLGYIPWGDYSHFRAFESNDDGEARINLNKVLGQLRFAHSISEPGLQLADIFASAITRALNKTLQPDGWRDFGRVLIHRNTEVGIGSTIRMVTLRTDPDAPAQVRKTNYFGWVLGELAARAKPMIPSEFTHLMQPSLHSD